MLPPPEARPTDPPLLACPVGDVYLAALSRRQPVCPSCAHLEAAGWQWTAGMIGVRWACRWSPLAPALTECRLWLREPGADDDAVPRRPRWSIVGKAD